MSMTRKFSVGIALGLCTLFPAPVLHAAPDVPPANNDAGPRPGGPFGGPGTEMTPEQRRARLLQPYEEALPDLTADQKTKLIEILEAAGVEIRAARADTKLTDEQKQAAQQRVRADLPNRVLPVLTEKQRQDWNELQEEQRLLLEGTVSHLGELQQGETREEKRARITAGYEDILEELSVKKRSAILEALGAADDAIATISYKPGLTDKQRQEEISKANDAAMEKITPLLSKDQMERWKKAQAAHVAKAAQVATAPRRDPEEGPQDGPPVNAFGVPVK
jgi:Spy/CpxP family protein refolding chaperone